jgi:hypothetical protein
MSTTIRNRIKEHRRVRAGDLIPHELNFRNHPQPQRAALEALYQEIGFARSLLAYELPDGRLKLIDGHLRRDLDPDMEVDVEILAVSDAEARTLLLSMDTLAALAETDARILARLREVAERDSQAAQALQRATEEACRKSKALLESKAAKPLPEQFLILIECQDEEHQVALLDRFQQEGLICKALLS